MNSLVIDLVFKANNSANFKMVEFRVSLQTDGRRNMVSFV